MKLIKGICFNVSIFRTDEGTELLSLQLRTEEGSVWKFNLGKAFDKKNVTDYGDIANVMSAKYITISTDDNNQRK